MARSALEELAEHEYEAAARFKAKHHKLPPKLSHHVRVMISRAPVEFERRVRSIAHHDHFADAEEMIRFRPHLRNLGHLMAGWSSSGDATYEVSSNLYAGRDVRREAVAQALAVYERLLPKVEYEATREKAPGGYRNVTPYTRDDVKELRGIITELRGLLGSSGEGSGRRRGGGRAQHRPAAAGPPAFRVGQWVKIVPLHTVGKVAQVVTEGSVHTYRVIDQHGGRLVWHESQLRPM